MGPSRRRYAAVVLSTLLGLAFTGAARSQPAAPAPAAPKPAKTGSAAEATPAKAGSAGDTKPNKAGGKDDKAAAGASGANSAGGESALPPGHPPMGGGLPQGHPPVEDEEDEVQPRGAPPPGHGRGGMQGEAPQDSVAEDESLPPGVVVVTVKDAEERPIPRAPLKLSVLHSSVARGDTSEEKTGASDDSGSFRFEGLTLGSATSYRIATTRGPATFAVGPFGLSNERGKRVTLHSYEVSTSIDEVLVGMQAMFYVSLREDALSIENLFSVFNLGAVAWVPKVDIGLPEGFKAFTKQDAAEGGVRVDELKGTGAGLRGTVGPGRHDAQFRYQVPLDREETQTLRVKLPPRVAMARVMVESSKSMGVKVDGFPPAERSQNRDGKRILVTGRQVSREEGGLQELVITITGLPTPGPGRWIAVVLTSIALLGAGAYVYQRRDNKDLDDDARQDLIEAREALLGEIVELERMHRRGEIGPKSYGRLRAALLDSLARIVEKLEGGGKRAATAAAAPP